MNVIGFSTFIFLIFGLKFNCLLKAKEKSVEVESTFVQGCLKGNLLMCDAVGRDYLEAKKFGEAKKYFLKACSGKKVEDVACVNLAEAEKQLGNVAAAREILKKRCDGKNYYFCGWLGYFEVEQKNSDLARLYFTMNCENTGNSCFSLGDLEKKLGHVELAWQAYAKACDMLRLENGLMGDFDPVECYGVGEYLEKMNKIQNSANAYNKACRNGGDLRSCKKVVEYEKKAGNVNSIKVAQTQACDRGDNNSCKEIGKSDGSKEKYDPKTIMTRLVAARSNLNIKKPETVIVLFELEKEFASFGSTRIEELEQILQSGKKIKETEKESEQWNEKIEQLSYNGKNTWAEEIERHKKNWGGSKEYFTYLLANRDHFKCFMGSDGFSPYCEVTLVLISSIDKTALGQQKKFEVLRANLLNSLPSCDAGVPVMEEGFEMGDTHGDSVSYGAAEIANMFLDILNDPTLKDFIKNSKEVLSLSETLKDQLRICLENGLSDISTNIVYSGGGQTRLNYREDGTKDPFFDKEIKIIQNRMKEHMGQIIKSIDINLKKSRTNK